MVDAVSESGGGGVAEPARLGILNAVEERRITVPTREGGDSSSGEHLAGEYPNDVQAVEGTRGRSGRRNRRGRTEWGSDVVLAFSLPDPLVWGATS